MKFSGSILALTLASVSAEKVLNLEKNIAAGSSIGQRIMSKARSLENNNQYYGWIQNYSIKFDGCAAVPRFEREEGFRSDLLAKFKLCPTSDSSCRHGGEYVVDMRELIESYQEYRQEQNEQACENAKENCEYQCQNNNNGNDDEYCQNQCLSDQGMSFCADEDGDNGADMNEIGECRALNEDDNNNNNNGNYNQNYQIYYVGAYCTSKGVFAGTFTDSACTKKAPSGTYEKLNYGYSLPTDALIPSGFLADCQSLSDDDGNAAYVSEFCEDIYEQSAKCENKVKNISYQDTSGCDLIHNILPRMNNAFKQMASGRSHSAAAVWAWIFGIASLLLCGYIFLLHKKMNRGKDVDVDKAGLV